MEQAFLQHSSAIPRRDRRNCDGNKSGISFDITLLSVLFLLLGLLLRYFSKAILALPSTKSNEKIKQLMSLNHN